MAISNLQDKPGSKARSDDVERRLDSGVEESFPASDPVALAQPHDRGELGLTRAALSPTAWLVVGGGLLALLALIALRR